MTVSLSIVIPSHRQVESLRACLQRVEAYAPAQTELIVVDDGSPGGVISRLASSFAPVKLVRHDQPRGFAAAANAGIQTAQGSVIELLNDDAFVTPGWAAAALACFSRNPKIAAVAPLVLQHNQPELIDSTGDEYNFGGYASKRGHGLAFTNAPALLTAPGEVWGANATAGFYRASVLKQLGGFSEVFNAYFEDVELAHRIRKLGYIAWYEPRSVVYHAISASYGRRPSRRLIEQQSRNEELVFLNHALNEHLVSRSVKHTFVLLAKAHRRWEEGTLAPWLRGRSRAMANALFATKLHV